MASPFRASALFCCLAAQTFAGNVSYQVTGSPSACHEVHLGRLGKPEGILLDVSTGNCHPEIRAGGETELFLTAGCELLTAFTVTFPTSREKYAVDLIHPNVAR
jgi:hypothetical protein